MLLLKGLQLCGNAKKKKKKKKKPIEKCLSRQGSLVKIICIFSDLIVGFRFLFKRQKILQIYKKREQLDECVCMPAC